jgi:hypothetical protein
MCSRWITVDRDNEMTALLACRFLQTKCIDDGSQYRWINHFEKVRIAHDYENEGIALWCRLYMDRRYGFTFRITPNRDILRCFCYGLFQWRYLQFKLCNTNRQRHYHDESQAAKYFVVIYQRNYFIWNEVLYLLIAPIDQQSTYLSLYPVNLEMSASEIWLCLPNVPMFCLIMLYYLWSVVLWWICNRRSAVWQVSLLSGTFNQVAPIYLSSVSFKI